MACIVFGVANHSPNAVVSALLKSRQAKCAGDIGVLPPGAKTDTRFKFLLLLSAEDFARNLSRLDNSGVKSFVFSNPIDLGGFSGLVGLDYVQVDEFSFNYIPLNMSLVSKATPVDIKRVPVDFLPRLIEHVKHGSLLNPLMTFIYSLPSSAQSEVKTAVITYLYRGQPAARLIESIGGLISSRAVDRLLAILSTSVAQSYAVALQTVKLLRRRKKQVSIPDIAKASGTSAYELSYMLSVLDEGSKYTDSFDKAKNRKSKPNDSNKSNR